MRVVALSGSLRSGSSNTAVLRLAAAVAPSDVTVTLNEDIATLPHFNPDLDAEGSVPPQTVASFRKALASAQGFIISSPEYAHGVPGSLKNAIDWIVSSGEIGGKPILLVSTSPPGTGQRAQTSLIQTLTVMDAKVLENDIVSVPFVRTRVNAQGDLRDDEVARALKVGLQALAKAIRACWPRH
jgi:NAD(P)H-dependent FMN reductase